MNNDDERDYDEEASNLRDMVREGLEELHGEPPSESELAEAIRARSRARHRH